MILLTHETINIPIVLQFFHFSSAPQERLISRLPNPFASPDEDPDPSSADNSLLSDPPQLDNPLLADEDMVDRQFQPSQRPTQAPINEWESSLNSSNRRSRERVNRLLQIWERFERNPTHINWTEDEFQRLERQVDRVTEEVDAMSAHQSTLSQRINARMPGNENPRPNLEVHIEDVPEPPPAAHRLVSPPRPPLNPLLHNQSRGNIFVPSPVRGSAAAPQEEEAPILLHHNYHSPLEEIAVQQAIHNHISGKWKFIFPFF